MKPETELIPAGQIEARIFWLRGKKVMTDILVSQNVIPSKKSLGGHLPYAFDECLVIASKAEQF